MRLKGASKDIAQLAKAVSDAGWRVRRSTNHLQFLSPCGQHLITGPISPSDYRAVRNLRSTLRRAGLSTL